MTYQEPSADLRKAANQIKELYESLLLAGFTEEQAFRLLAEYIRGAWGAGNA